MTHNNFLKLAQKSQIALGVVNVNKIFKKYIISQKFIHAISSFILVI